VQLDEQLGIARAEVTAARALNQEQQTTLEAKLAARIEKKSLRCAYTVDEGLLGGLTVRIGSRVLDGSVRESSSRCAGGWWPRPEARGTARVEGTQGFKEEERLWPRFVRTR